MADEVQNTNNNPIVPLNSNGNKGSKVCNLSVRSIIALLLVITLCVSVLIKLTLPEYFTLLVTNICSFYFGHIQGQSNNGKSL